MFGYPFKAVPCKCGHRGCKDWHVSHIADVQGVHFTLAQASAVAEFLNNRVERGLDREDDHGG